MPLVIYLPYPIDKLSVTENVIDNTMLGYLGGIMSLGGGGCLVINMSKVSYEKYRRQRLSIPHFQEYFSPYPEQSRKYMCDCWFALQ